jgi:hypothetical protein
MREEMNYDMPKKSYIRIARLALLRLANPKRRIKKRSQRSFSRTITVLSESAR